MKINLSFSEIDISTAFRLLGAAIPTGELREVDDKVVVRLELGEPIEAAPTSSPAETGGDATAPAAASAPAAAAGEKKVGLPELAELLKSAPVAKLQEMVAVLGRFGVKRITELKPEQYDEAYRALKEVL